MAFCDDASSRSGNESSNRKLNQTQRSSTFRFGTKKKNFSCKSTLYNSKKWNLVTYFLEEAQVRQNKPLSSAPELEERILLTNYERNDCKDQRVINVFVFKSLLISKSFPDRREHVQLSTYAIGCGDADGSMAKLQEFSSKFLGQIYN